MIPQNFIVADEVAPFDVFSKNGYYTVGNKIFNFKFNALVESTRTGVPPQWHFHEDAFTKISWKNRGLLRLDQLYKLRAQQLRDKYDYIVLAFSGGADSHQILKTFLNNNIKLDEIIVDWSIKHVDKILDVSTNTDPSNFFSEWELCIRPTLDWVKNNYPNIKITLVDSTETLSAEDFEDTPTVLNNLTTYQSVKRYRRFKERIRNLNDQYDNVVTIFGIEKPTLTIDRGILCMRYRDDATWIKTTHNNNLKFDVEYFYWSPDLPDIVKEQAHIIFQMLLHQPQWQYLFIDAPKKIYIDPNLNLSTRKFVRTKNDTINKLIYPDWDTTFFQADKPDSHHNNQQHVWILSKGTPIELESWFSALNSMRSQINESFFGYFEDTTVPTNYRAMLSRLYPIGKLKL